MSHNLFHRTKYFQDASPRFLEDSMLKDDMAVVPRSPDLHCIEIGGPLKVTVLGHACSTLNYQHLNKPVLVHRFVVMDGNNGVFKVHLNVLHSKRLDDTQIPNGSTLIINKWKWLWMELLNESWVPAISHGVLLAHDYDLRLSLQDPSWGYSPSNSHTTCPTATMDIDHSVIDYVGNNSHLVWMEPNHAKVMQLMPNKGLQAGLFIPDLGDRKKFLKDVAEDDWLNYPYFENEENEPPTQCSCLTDFGFVPCVCEQYPVQIAHQQRSYIFEMVKKVLPDQDLVGSFDCLQPSKQRACILWYYSIQVFQVGGPNQKGLPPCLLNMVRTEYPNPKKDFFHGYKMVEQSNVEDLRKRVRLETELEMELCNDFQSKQIPLCISKSVFDLGGAIGSLSTMVGQRSPVSNLGNQVKIVLHVKIVLEHVVTLASLLGLDLVVLVKKKLLVNEKKYPSHLCLREREIKKYTYYSSVTGIRTDGDVPLGLEILLSRDRDGASPHQINREKFQRYYFDLLNRVTEFSRLRGWLNKYDLPTLVCSLFSEFGELVELIQWKDKNSMTTYYEVQEGLARELADITIYCFHMLREVRKN